MAKCRGSVVERGGGSRREFWAGRIAACEASGVSIAQYCRDRGLSHAGYQWWKSELKRRSVPARLAEVQVAPLARSVAAIEISVRGAREVSVHSGFDEPTLLRALAVLEQLLYAGGA